MGITRRSFIASAAGASLPLLHLPTMAQERLWPKKDVRIVTAFAAGGQTDLFARTYGDYIKSRTGCAVVVENKPGANGSIAAVDVKKAEPDGHTLLFTLSGTMITNPLLIKDLSYDPDKDFTLVSAMPTGSICFVASDKSGARTLAEFIDYARKAEKVSIGTFGAGSIAHLMIAELNREFGLKIEAVHYRGEVPMWADLSGQFIDAGVGSYSGSLSVTQTGRGKTVAVSIKRNPKLPEIPTFKEQGASSPAFSITTFQCCVAPSGTPERVAREISNLLVEAGKTDKIMQMLDKFGIADPAMDFDATQRLYKNESPVWKELVSKLGIVL